LLLLLLLLRLWHGRSRSPGRCDWEATVVDGANQRLHRTSDSEKRGSSIEDGCNSLGSLTI
jgi:hypothetical protein